MKLSVRIFITNVEKIFVDLRLKNKIYVRKNNIYDG